MTTLTDKLFGRERRELKIVFALVVLTLSAVLLYPLGCVLFQSILDGNGSLTLANYTSLLSETRFWNALSNSLCARHEHDLTGESPERSRQWQPHSQEQGVSREGKSKVCPARGRLKEAGGKPLSRRTGIASGI